MPALSRRELFIGAAAGATGVAAGGIAGIEAYRSSSLLRKFPRWATPSYASSGEDVIVRLFFGHLLRDNSKPSYLDVGAYWPITGNNTYLFYTMGGRGVLIEPNIALIPELKAKRPGDIVLNIGIGVTEQKEADYYCYSKPWWNINTFDKAVVEERTAKSGTKPEKVVKMPLVPINRVIEEHFGGKAPDFLSTDVEGLDLAILKTLDFHRFRPKVICAETVDPEYWGPAVTPMDPEITNFLTEKGYESRAMTYQNTIYIDKAVIS
jgi:FkbM family methyltransferase